MNSANIAIIFDLCKKCNYLCGCEWLYGTYFGPFWGFMVDYEAVAMVPFLPLGRTARIQSLRFGGDATAVGGQDNKYQ